MSRTMNIMVAVRKSLIEKYKIATIITGTGRKSRFLDFYVQYSLFCYPYVFLSLFSYCFL